GAGDRGADEFMAVRGLRKAVDGACNRCGRRGGEGHESGREKTERAARQQGSSSLRENSSNGGKTIRTFWLHSRGGGRECQGQIEHEINHFYSISCKSFAAEDPGHLFGGSSPFSSRVFQLFHLF